ncbi:MAG: hypothetical protein ACFFAS_06620 [Promethearchaeota archaeon]
MTRIKVRNKNKASNEEKETDKKEQPQSIYQKLGMTPEEQKNIESKLYISHYLDVFSEQTFNLIYKDKFLEKYQNQFATIISDFGSVREEDKLLKNYYEDKNIPEVLNRIKSNAEDIAVKKDYTQSIEQKYRKMNYLFLIPMIAVFAILFIAQLLGYDLMIFSLPFICLFCFGPRYYRSYLIKKWSEFIEGNKNELYQLNRDDLIVIKQLINSLFQNTRDMLLEKKIPLEIIKFRLLSSDYDCLKVEAQDTIRGRQLQSGVLVSFEYPEGVDPIPLPEEFEKLIKPLKKRKEKLEKNFVLLSNPIIENGIIKSFVPTLKVNLANEINSLLNQCSFELAKDEIDEIIPNYSPENSIYCVCGEIMEIRSIQICNWKDIFKFYLIEGKECSCGEMIYALSLMDVNSKIPETLEEIFSD